ncbi:MAG: ThiF family adenylyltransferase [Bacillota bacterium]
MDTTQLPQNRYHRQMLLPQIGPEGQRKLAAARVLLVGCGALGTVLAEQLVRAGVGYLRIADRDIVELSNLQRQVLFDEEDVRQCLPKAVAAANRLGRINSSVRIDPQVVDVHASNIEELAGLDSSVFGNDRGGRQAVDLILDGTDNVETRYLINDLSAKLRIPWIYGAVIATEGRVMPILPGRTPCLRCIFPEPPAPGELATCDTAGVLGSAVNVVASFQAAIAMKILTGNQAAVAEELITLDLWANRMLSVSVKDARREDCPTCAQRRFEFLNAVDGPGTTSLCGRNAVQIRPSTRQTLNLEQVASRLAHAGQVSKTPYFVRCSLADPAGAALTVFPDGRVIVHGTQESMRARSIVARFVGI